MHALSHVNFPEIVRLSTYHAVCRPLSLLRNDDHQEIHVIFVTKPFHANWLSDMCRGVPRGRHPPQVFLCARLSHVPR